MHNGIAAVERLRELRGIRDIADNEFESCRQLFMAGTKVVVNNYFIAPALQRVRGVTAYVTSSPNHQNGQVSSLKLAFIIIEGLSGWRKGRADAPAHATSVGVNQIELQAIQPRL